MSFCRRDSYSYSGILLTDAFLHSSFKPEDIQPFSGELIDTVLTKLESAGSPEKLAENDFMMKCKEKSGCFIGTVAHETTLLCGQGIMRIIFTTRQSLATTNFDQTLQRLVRILGATSKNPSNPNFDQYLFESLSGLLRQVEGGRRVHTFTTHPFVQICRCSEPSDGPHF
jgi:exportin-2 (importin alpha re-exporter)